MTPAETAAILRQFNEWRLDDEDLPQPGPKQITAAIYAAVEMIERLDALRAELKAAHAMALNGVEWRELAKKYEAEIQQLRKEADKFDDGIDWIQRALQAESEVEAMKRQEPEAKP